MAPNPNLEARILVCDGSGRLLEKITPAIANRFVGVTGGTAEVSVVRKLRQVSPLVTAETAPHYGLVVYDANQLTREGVANIAAVNRHDPFIPQMVVGDFLEDRVQRLVDAINVRLQQPGEIGSDESFVRDVFRGYAKHDDVIGRAARAGVHYHAANSGELQKNLVEHIFGQAPSIPDPAVLLKLEEVVLILVGVIL